MPAGTTTYVDVRALTMVKTRVEQALEVKSKKQAVLNNFRRRTGRNAPRAMTNLLWNQASLPRNRNHITGTMNVRNLTQEYYNSIQNSGINWKKVNGKWTNSPQNAVGGGGSSRKRKTRRPSKALTRRNRK